VKALILVGMAVYAVALFLTWTLLRVAATADSEYPDHHDDESDDL
jgi:hypothetical protein